MQNSLITKNQTGQVPENDPIKRLEVLDNKIKGFETTKIKTESELEMLKKQHTELIEELKEYGIEDVEDLPNLIQELQKEFDKLLTEAENNVKTTEETITSLQSAS